MNKTLTSITTLSALAFLIGFSSVIAATTYSKEYLENSNYVFEQLSSSPDGQFDLSDDRQYNYLLNTLENTDCLQNQQVMRDLNHLRANHKRFGGPSPALAKNDDNPEGIIEAYNETTAMYPLNDEGTIWGATALSSVPGGTDYSCVVLQIHLVGPGVNEPIGESASQDLSCGVNFQLATKTNELSTEQLDGLDAGEFRLVPRLTYVYREINGPAKAGTGELPPVTSNVPKLMKVQEPIQKQANVGKPYIKVCISRSQQNDCDYDYTNAQKELILPLKGQITYNRMIADPTADGSKGFASIRAVNTTTGGSCVEPHDIGSSFYTDPNTSWDAGGGTVLDWDIPSAQIGKIVGCATNGAVMDFVQVLTLNLISPNGIQFPVSTSITSEASELAGPTVFKMPYLSTFSGCLAEDTKITLADDKGTKVISSEDLFSQSNPITTQGSPDGKLWVQGNSIGMELRMSFQVKDDKGNTVVMTPEHPIFGKNPGDTAGWIFAKDLQIGAELSTLDGPSTVTSIEQINYEDRVYNLFVSNEDGSEVPREQMNFYANNILVGDGTMQTLMVQEAQGLDCNP